MKTTKVWCFAFAAVVLAMTIFSTRITGLDESVRERQPSQRRWWWKQPTPPPPPPFFAGNVRPEGLPGISGGTEIAQTLPTDPPGTPPYFVSLFDSSTNTPFYSAYKVTPRQASNLNNYSRRHLPRIHWRNPPGAPLLDNAYKEAIGPHGYNEPLSRGHMDPLGINTFQLNSMEATFTLTNAVPQFEASNSNDWQTSETKIRDYAKNDCGTKQGTLYLLTGRSEMGLMLDPRGNVVQDNSNTIPKPFLVSTFQGGRVTLETPRSIWTAGCCVWTQPRNVFKLQFWAKERAESFAVMSNNQKTNALLHQTDMSVGELEKFLKPPASRDDVNLFPGKEICRLIENHKNI